MNLDKIKADLRASPHCRLLGAWEDYEGWWVWGMYVRIKLEPCGCFAWGGSSPQYTREGTHITPEVLRRWLSAKDREEVSRIWAEKHDCGTPFEDRPSWTRR